MLSQVNVSEHDFGIHKVRNILTTIVNTVWTFSNWSKDCISTCGFVATLN